MTSTPPISMPSGRFDLRREPVDAVVAWATSALGTVVDESTLIRKRRTIGARTDRGTWARIEARPFARIVADGQPGNGMEAAELLTGIAKPAWLQASTWSDTTAQVMWRADEVELIAAAPVRAGGALTLSRAWWDTFNASLDNLAAQRTTRRATPDTQPISQELVSATIENAFPGQVEVVLGEVDWVPAHADMNWSNVTGPECWIIDWEDHGMAPRGLDSATLWVSSLMVPALAERVYEERRADLESRPGRLMALFHCSKILTDSGAADDPIYEHVSREARKLVELLAA